MNEPLAAYNVGVPEVVGSVELTYLGKLTATTGSLRVTCGGAQQDYVFTVGFSNDMPLSGSGLTLTLTVFSMNPATITAGAEIHP
jgi:hypothetical protein